MRKPKEIKRIDSSGLQITWNEEQKTLLSGELLRRFCPCAECREIRGDSSHAAPLTPKKSLLKIVEHSKEEEIGIDAIWAVGGYALGIKFVDGHDSGIFTFDYLQELSGKGI